MYVWFEKEVDLRILFGANGIVKAVVVLEVNEHMESCVARGNKKGRIVFLFPGDK